MCRVATCCCCLSLRTGAILTACLLLLESALALLLLSWTAYVMTMALDETAHNDLLSEDQKDMATLVLQGGRAVLILEATASGVSVLVNIVLLAGAINMRRLLVFSWLVGYGLVYSLVLILIALGAGGFFLQGNNTAGIYTASSILVHTVVVGYLWVVVKSFHCELKGEHGGTGNVYRLMPSCEEPVGRYSNAMPMAPPEYSA